MRIVKTTPVLVVDRIEPALPFYEALGYEKVAGVPHGEVLGFAILVREGLELMLQTKDSIADDLPEVARRGLGAVLFHEVDDLAAAQKALGATKILVGPRDTPYGMREVWVADPAGQVHGFAQPK